MRRAAAVVAAIVLSVTFGASSASAQTDAVSVATALIAAENAHDVDAAVSLFAPGAIVNLPTGPLVGRAQIDQWQRELAAGNFRAEITPPVAVTPEVVTFSGTVALDSFRRLGISPLEATWELTVQLGRVTIFNFSFTAAAAARLQAALAGGGGGAQAGGAQPGGGPAAGVGGAVQSGGATTTTGRSLALTGGNGNLARFAGMTVVGGLLFLFSDRLWLARRAGD